MCFRRAPLPCRSIMRLLRTTMALCAFFVPAAIVAGCGDEGGIPGNAVAEVDGTPIERTEYDHWLNVAAKSSGAPDATVPKPPDFTECVAAAKKTQAKPAEGQPKLTDQQLKDQCKQQYEQLRDQVLGLLISFEWIEREAADQGVKVTDEEVNKSFEEQKKQTFPKDADYQKFLKDSGQTEEDVRMRVRLDLLSNKIRDQVIKGKDQVSEQQITDYYNKNKERFAQPERRDLSIVLTKKEAEANEGQQEKAFDDAIFAAEKGKITGPVKTQFGYYVFKVDKVTEASQQTRDEAKETIKQLLASQNQQKALDAYVKEFRKRWKEKTDCREGFVTQDCK